jgi:hypothetical protein
LLPHPFSLHVPAILFLSFYKFHNILSVYGSIQFFIISNSPNIPLLDRPVDLSLYIYPGWWIR